MSFQARIIEPSTNDELCVEEGHTADEALALVKQHYETQIKPASVRFEKREAGGKWEFVEASD